MDQLKYEIVLFLIYSNLSKKGIHNVDTYI